MEKTKLGVSVGLVGAVMWLTAFYGGYLAAFAVAAYVLIVEKDEWLKKLCVKAIVTMFAFSVVSTLIYLLPDLFGQFGGSVLSSLISRITGIAGTIVNLVEKIIFILFAFLSLSKNCVEIPFLDAFVEKHMGKAETVKTTETADAE